MTKRICLFAGYDLDGIIDDYVIYYIKELSKISDVYYLGDFSPKDKELNKLKDITKGAYAFRHKKYDFGSWQELVRKIGKEEIRKYDELIFANDSCFGPLFPFENLFKKMNEKECDFWGLSCSRGYHIHIQSYFLVFKKKVIEDDTLFEFLETVKPQKSLADVCTNYEERLAYVLTKSGFEFKTLVPYGDYHNQPYFSTTHSIENVQFPLLKVKTFYGEVGKEPLKNYEKLLKDNTDYDVNLIKNNLYRRGLDDKKIKQNLYYNKKMSKILRLKNLIKRIIRKIFRILSLPLRKYIQRFVDFKLDCVSNSFNNQIESLNNEIRNLKNQIYSLLPLEDVTTLEEDKYVVTNDGKNKIEYFLPDDYYVIKETLSILENFDKYGKDILFLGNFSVDSCSIFKVLENRLFVSHSKNIDKECKLLEKNIFDINDISKFEIKKKNKKVLFDLIFVEPFKENITDEEIKKIFKHLHTLMVEESVLIINTKFSNMGRIKKIMEDLPFEDDLDGIRIYSNKVVSKMGYSVLFFRKKRQIDNEGIKK